MAGLLFMPRFDADFIKKALRDYDRTWKLQNEFLYELCRKHPRHTEDNAIIAKFCIIGRTYAAAVERRRKPKNKADETGEDSGGAFYVNKLAPLIRENKIDKWLDRLNGTQELSPIEVHGKLTDLLNKGLTHQDKRSLSSKYLHFHFRDKFFIYDSYANASANSLIRRFHPDHKRCKCVPKKEGIDREYAKFFHHCAWLVQFIQEKKFRTGRPLSPRELDTVLGAWYRENKNELAPEAKKAGRQKKRVRVKGKLLRPTVTRKGAS